MKKLIAVGFVAAVALALALPAAAADETLPQTGRVLIAIGGDVSLPTGEQADAVVVVGGHAAVRGEAGAVVVIDGSATITGTTIDSLYVLRGSAELRETSVLSDIRTLDAEVERTQVTVAGTVRGLEGDLVGLAWFLAVGALMIWIGFGIATLVAGLLSAGLAGRQMLATAELIRREPGRAALAGLLALLVPPLVVVVLMVTVIGIPLGVSVLLFAWPFAAFIGYLVGALWLGLLVQRTLRGREATVERPYGAMVIGLLLAFVLALIPLAVAIVSFLGLGAVVLAGWRTLRGTPGRKQVLQVSAAPA